MNVHDEVMLTMVSENNSNKFYRMIPSADGNTFTAEYGRIGCSNPQRRTYPICQYGPKYNEKINKGYRDVTRLVSRPKDHMSASAALDGGTEAQKVVAMLMDYADSAYRDTYTLDLRNVTEDMLREAESLVNTLRVRQWLQRNALYPLRRNPPCHEGHPHNDGFVKGRICRNHIKGT